jgi:hypothetical protein
MKRISGIFMALLGLMIVPMTAFAQAVVAQPTYLDGILKFIAGIGASTGVAVIVVEAILRLFPSAQPISLLVPVKYLLDGCIEIFKFVSDFIGSLISGLNVVVPAPAAPASKSPQA